MVEMVSSHINRSIHQSAEKSCHVILRCLCQLRRLVLMVDFMASQAAKQNSQIYFNDVEDTHGRILIALETVCLQSVAGMLMFCPARVIGCSCRCRRSPASTRNSSGEKSSRCAGSSRAGPAGAARRCASASSRPRSWPW